MEQGRVVKTGVDELIDLVLERKGISVEEAAQILTQPPHVVESWANFLEEENLIKIKYSGITPYLYPAAKGDLPKGVPSTLPIPKPVKSEKAKKFRFKFPFFRKTTKEDAKLNVPSPKASGKLNVPLPKPGQKLAIPKPGLAKPLPPSKTRPTPEIKVPVPTPPHEAPKSKDVLAPPPPPRKRIEPIISMKKEEAPARDKELLVPPKKVELKLPTNTVNKIDLILKEIKVDIRKNELDQAVEKSLEAEKEFRNIPPTKTKERIELEERLMALQSELLSKRYEQMRKIHEQATFNISKSVLRTKQLINSGKITEAEKEYANLVKIKSRMPDGFVSEDAKVERHLVLLHEDLMQAILVYQGKLVQIRTRQVMDALQQCKKLLKTNNLIAANESYHQAVESYSKIPDGFLEKKLAVYRMMLPVLTAVLEAWQSSITKKKSNSFDEMQKLLKQADEFLKQKNTDGAKHTYMALTKQYSLLPEGFLKEKTDIRMRMIALYKKIRVQDHARKNI